MKVKNLDKIDSYNAQDSYESNLILIESYQNYLVERHKKVK